MSGSIDPSWESGGIVTLRINNPRKFNAMSLTMWQDLGVIVAELCDDPSVRVLLLRGEGERAFISGADISEFESSRSAESGTEVYDRAVEGAQVALAQASFPVIACIHGVCMGGGLGLAMACDLRYCATNSRFRMPAANLGLGYGLAGIRQLVAALGGPRVADLFYTARTFDGEEAMRIGAVHTAFSPETLDAEVASLATAVAANAPLTLRLVKAAIRQAQWPVEDGDADIAAARARCMRSGDYVEGRLAFAEKRLPRFTGS
jgi:enoyl-CoA hydratase/carnithine racemase